MPFSFLAFVFTELVVGLPVMAYYYYWGEYQAHKKVTSSQKDAIQANVKRAYQFTAISTVLMSSLLVLFLYVNIRAVFGMFFIVVSSLMTVVIAVFEVIHYYVYLSYEKPRLANIEVLHTQRKKMQKRGKKH